MRTFLSDLKGTRNPRRWVAPDESGRRPPAVVRVGRCRICGRLVRSNQSYHRDARGLAHLRCEHALPVGNSKTP